MPYVEPGAEGGNEADGPLSAARARTFLDPRELNGYRVGHAVAPCRPRGSGHPVARDVRRVPRGGARPGRRVDPAGRARGGRRADRAARMGALGAARRAGVALARARGGRRRGRARLGTPPPGQSRWPSSCSSRSSRSRTPSTRCTTASTRRRRRRAPSPPSARSSARRPSTARTRARSSSPSWRSRHRPASPTRSPAPRAPTGAARPPSSHPPRQIVRPRLMRARSFSGPARPRDPFRGIALPSGGLARRNVGSNRPLADRGRRCVVPASPGPDRRPRACGGVDPVRARLEAPGAAGRARHRRRGAAAAEPVPSATYAREG